MDERLFWFHPDANAEVLAAHDRYAEVTNELAERFQDELERSRQTIAQSSDLAYLFVRNPALSNEELSVLHCISRDQNQDRDYCRSTRAAKTGVLDSTHRVVATDNMNSSTHRSPKLVRDKLQRWNK